MSTRDSHPQPTLDETHASVLMDISNTMVRLYKEHFGRGPTTARTYRTSPDMLTAVLEHTLTPAERNLVALNEHERLRDTRMFFQYATVRQFCEPVEQITGRTVRAFISGIDTHVDGISIGTFILHPEGYTGASRTEISRM